MKWTKTVLKGVVVDRGSVYRKQYNELFWEIITVYCSKADVL